VDLRHQPTSGTTDAIVAAATGAGPMLMTADDGAVDHLDLGVAWVRDRIQDAVPDARASPSHEPIVAGGVRAVALGQSALWRTGPQYPEDAIQDPPVINPWYTVRLGGKDRLNELPFGVG
jgi:hypothetical protein